ncbi:MAG TPA: hypothetical protein VKU19_28930 [Bryobacteraceae bacterium]|nr:hypothetical protein [Bryobacteraceae bacterium]
MTTKERLDSHDRQIAAIRKLLQTGMRMLVKMQEDQQAMRKDLRELAAMQKRTEASLQSLINTMKRGGNGHTKRGVDLQ